MRIFKLGLESRKIILQIYLDITMGKKKEVTDDIRLRSKFSERQIASLRKTFPIDMRSALSSGRLKVANSPCLKFCPMPSLFANAYHHVCVQTTVEVLSEGWACGLAGKAHAQHVCSPGFHKRLKNDGSIEQWCEI